MTDEQVRIVLAEAMGLTVAPVTIKDCGGPFLVTDDPADTDEQMQVAEWREFSPFTDANDDYAVLDFARRKWKGTIKWKAFSEHLKVYMRDSLTDYEIGDYARAALKVIQND